MRENHYAIFVFDMKSSYVFKLQDKHNASFSNIILHIEIPLYNHKFIQLS